MKFDKYEKLGAYHWDWYADPNFAWYKECVDRVVKFCKGVTIDVGCGDGVVLQKLADKGVRAVGIDNDEEAVMLCAARGLNVLLMDLEFPMYPLIWEDAPPEYVCSLNTIEHLKNPAAVMELVRMATKGAIIITDKAEGRPGRYHEHEYTKTELLELFKDFDLELFEIESTENGRPVSFIGVEIKK